VRFDDSVSVGEASHSTNWSTSSPPNRRGSMNSSFASLTLSPRSRHRSYAAATAANSARLASLHRRQLRTRQWWVGTAKLVASLFLTMVARFYLDPNGHAALLATRTGGMGDAGTSHAPFSESLGIGGLLNAYDQPMGFLGATQLALVLHLLVKLQRFLEEEI